MNPFDSFFRFFTVADDNAVRPVNTALPQGQYPTLPAVPGDALRFFVPRSDSGGLPAQQLTIGIRKATDNTPGTLCGILRKQAGEQYTEIRLRVNEAVSDTYKQFAIMVDGRNVMGTFRGQQSDIDQYIQAIIQHYVKFPFALVEADRMGQDIRLRVYPNDRFSVNGEKLTIGLGTVKERNENSPSLLAQKIANLNLPAIDRYSLAVSSDIQKGNVYTLGNVSYTASGTEKPADILRALGEPTGLFTRDGGSVVIAYVQPGKATINNTNSPTLQLLFDATAGGNDRYLVTVSADVQIGNVYQVSASGSATRTVTAVAGDTKASIEAQFNTVSGKFVLPSGSAAIISTLPGSQVIDNTNNPSITLKQIESLPARTVDRYTVYVGTSMATGNEYELTKGGDINDVVATADDTPLSIAGQFGYSSNPFTVDVVPGTNFLAIGRKGALYNSDDNTAAVTLLSVRTFSRLPYVADIKIPTLTPERYQFVLRSGTTVVGLSNYVQVKSGTHNTSLIRFGSEKPGSVFGTVYAEDGLMQQIRLPLYVDSANHTQEESLYTDLENKTYRGRTSMFAQYPCVTTMQPEAFHRNLIMALKHPVLYVDEKMVRCEGQYSETTPKGRRRIRQGSANLKAVTGYDYRPTYDPLTDLLSGLYCTINSMKRLDGLFVQVKRLNFVSLISEGVSLPAAEYDILIRAGADPLRLTISHEGTRVATFLLTPNRLHHLSHLRFEPGLIDLLGEVVTDTVQTTSPELYDPQQAEPVTSTGELLSRGADFGPDFSTAFH